MALRRGSGLATAHDILTTLAFIKLLDIEVSLTVVAAILTVIGYSLNDTIIIFDRVREDLRKKRKESLYDTLKPGDQRDAAAIGDDARDRIRATLALLLLAGEVIRHSRGSWRSVSSPGHSGSVYVRRPRPALDRAALPAGRVRPPQRAGEGA